MPEFNIGDFRFVIIDHMRIVKDGSVKERFVVDAYYQDKPLDWHPNQDGREDYPGLPHRTNYEFVGREFVPVFNDGIEVGSKRGADFRTRFFPNLVHVASKALAARELGKAIGEVRTEEVTKFAFQEPMNLKAQTIDKAVELVTGKVVSAALSDVSK